MPVTSKIVLTVDVEDYYQVEAFSGIVDRERWAEWPSRVVDNTRRLLEIFNSFGVLGTFFVLGWVAEKYPGLVRDIRDAGHEVASHGFNHKMLTAMRCEEFRDDVRRSKKILEKSTGSPVDGYRAPTFSLIKKTEWAYAILLEEGYSYSSSVFPICHDRYGWPDFGQAPRKMASNGKADLWEIPMSVGSVGGIKIPFGGGGYLRAYPLSMTHFLFKRNMIKNEYPVFYVHPWEIDPGQPVIKSSFLNGFRHYQGIQGLERKIRRLLHSFEFLPMREYLNQKVIH